MLSKDNNNVCVCILVYVVNDEDKWDLSNVLKKNHNV
jgi:hypothetical protein